VVVSYVDGGGTTESVTATTSFVAGQDIVGTRANDSLVGGAGNDTIDGAGGRDTMTGGGGNDLYYVNDSRDVVVENPNGGDDTVISTANYVLSANVENLTLSGRAETGKGNALDNVIIGDSSSNVITGLGGADTLTGGARGDTFVYTSTSDSSPTAYDTITDFNAAQKDKIDLRLIDARDNVPGNQSFKFIGTAEFVDGANNSGLLRFDPVTHMLEGSTNADADPEFCILLVGVDHIGKDAGGISAASILL
jgi:Ca2+-binding RTX toxin-like protein